MKRNYTKPTIEAVPWNMDRPLLAGSNSDGISATISGYQSSVQSSDNNTVADDDDDFDGFLQDSFEK